MCAAQPQQIIVIGGDAAGMSFASKVKREKPNWEVVVFERGKYVSYAACGIPYYVSRDVDSLDDLQIITAEQFREKRGINVRMGWEVVAIDREAQTVHAKNLESGETKNTSYDQLMIATGANATKPPINGIDLTGVFSVRNLNDADQIHTYLDTEQPSHGVVIGGGYIGLEMTEALTARGVEVQIIEMLPQVLSPMDEPVTAKVMEELQSQDITVHLASKANALRGKNGKIQSVTVAGMDKPIPAEIVIVASGIKPNSELAVHSSLEVGESGGIIVDANMQTSDPKIYAGGDCVEQYHIVSGKPAYVPLGPAANKHGRIAALNVVGNSVEFPGIVGTAVMKVFDLTISRTGLTETQAEDAGFDYFTQTIQTKERAGYYPGGKKLTLHLVVEENSGRLLGAQIAGGTTAAKRIDPYAVALHNGMKIQDIALLDLSYAPPYSPVLDPVGLAAQVASGKLNTS